MAISPYVRRLRDAVGGGRLLLPSLTALIYDGRGGLPLSRWLRSILPGFYARPAANDFRPPGWLPQHGSLESETRVACNGRSS